MNITTHFNLTSLKTKGLTLLIEHSPCCLLSFASGALGMSVFNHNPLLELGFAVGGAFAGDHIGHKYLHKECDLDRHSNNPVRRYSMVLCFGLASWGTHQMFFHDSITTQHNHKVVHYEYDCNHAPYENMVSFASPELQRYINKAHDKKHEEKCSAHERLKENPLKLN